VGGGARAAAEEEPPDFGEERNEALADFLRKNPSPEVKELAVVPDAERYTVEAAMVRQLGKKHKLLNKYWNGWHHTPETRAKMSLGQRRRYAARTI
jgi:hypothetical protein